MTDDTTGNDANPRGEGDATQRESDTPTSGEADANASSEAGSGRRSGDAAGGGEARAGPFPDHDTDGRRTGDAVGGGEASVEAACGGVAVHGDWNLRGNGTAVEDYVIQAREFLEHSRIYLADGHLHQASEKGWGAAAHMAKAVALTQGWDYSKHADFHFVMQNVWQKLENDRVRPLLAVADHLHGNFYRRKRFLNADAIGADLEDVAELVDLLEPLTTAA